MKYFEKKLVLEIELFDLYIFFHSTSWFVMSTQILIILKILKLNLGNFLGYIRILDQV